MQWVGNLPCTEWAMPRVLSGPVWTVTPGPPFSPSPPLPSGQPLWGDCVDTDCSCIAQQWPLSIQWPEEIISLLGQQMGLTGVTVQESQEPVCAPSHDLNSGHRTDVSHTSVNCNKTYFTVHVTLMDHTAWSRKKQGTTWWEQAHNKTFSSFFFLLR